MRSQLQFLNLPQIDAAIQQNRAAEFQNALAPYVQQKYQMDAERGQLEMQQMRDSVEQQRQIRAALTAQYAEPAQSQLQAQAPMQGNDGADYRGKQAAMLRKQADVYMRFGNVDAANKLHEQALKLEPEFSQTPQYDQTGNAFVLDKQGNPKYLDGVKARDKIVSDDLGGKRVYRTEYSADPLASANKTQTPDSIASNAIANANLAVSRERLAFEKSQPKGQVVTTDQGVVLVDPRGGTAQPVTLNGQPLQPKLKDVPAPVNTAISTNVQNLNRAQTALALLEGKDVGEMKGDKSATGWKGFLPNTVLNRADPEGVDARASIADLGSLVIHDRSGTAVTAAEFPRLAPFIPTPTDDADTAKKKLRRFVQVYQAEVDALSDTYSKEQGFKPNPMLQRNAVGGGGSANPGRVESDTMPNPAQHKGAIATDQATGVKYKSDGKNWVRQ
jgi:hypothetical protein